MAKVSFSKADREAAEKDKKVLVALALDGTAAAGFPFRDYQHGGLLPPELARELVRAYADIMVRAVKGDTQK